MICPACELPTYEPGYGCHNCDYNVQNIENEKREEAKDGQQQRPESDRRNPSTEGEA